MKIIYLPIFMFLALIGCQSTQQPLSLEARLLAAGLTPQKATETIDVLKKGASESLHFFKSNQINPDDQKLVEIWKWLTLKEGEGKTTGSAFQLAREHYGKSEWRDLLKHSISGIVYEAINYVTSNNDSSAVPRLIDLLQSDQRIVGGMNTEIRTVAAKSLIELTHFPIDLPKWTDNADAERAHKEWSTWCATNSQKTQEQWIQNSDSAILKLLSSNHPDDAFRGFLFSKHFDLFNDKLKDILKNYNPTLDAKLITINDETFMKLTNLDEQPAIVAFKHGAYRAGRSVSDTSPYLPDWHYAMMLKKGESWQTKIKSNDARSCTVTERLRGIPYNATKSE